MRFDRPDDGLSAARAAALLMSAYAAILALALMFWARQVWQIRMLPERIMEAALRLISPAQFEAAIERYGPNAKEYGLYATTLALFLVLAAVGYIAQRRVRRPGALLELGVALWFIGMVVVMPLTGGGVFGAGLLVNPLLVNIVYFGIGMAYASTLLLGRLISLHWLRSGVAGAAPVVAADPSRRSLLLGTGVSAASLAAGVLVDRVAGLRASNLPLAAVPVTETPAPTAIPAATPTPTAPEPSPLSTAAGATAAAVMAPATPTAPPPTVAALPAATAGATATPAYPAPPVRGLARDKDGALVAVQRAKGVVQSPVTSNADFYVVTKNAAGDPLLDARAWRLIVNGAVARPVQLDYPSLLRLPHVTVYKTLECISNLTAKCDLTSFGCDLISTASWTGVRLKDVLDLAGGLAPGAAAVVAFSADEYSSALPLEVANNAETLVVYQMNGAVLPREHGFPVRLLVPGHYGMKSAKWVVNLKVMMAPYTDWWGQNGWSHSAVVKTMARLDVPVAGAVLPPGPRPVGGIAYGGDRGIAKVEYSADGGTSWATAALMPGPGTDTFVRWAGTFRLAAGQTAHLVCRATDGSGTLQAQQFSLPQPDGGAGWDSITVKAG